MLDLPSCASVDFAKAHPEMMAVGADGKENTGGDQDQNQQGDADAVAAGKGNLE